MKSNVLLAYVSSFVSLLLERTIIHEQVTQVIVFGSVARGDFDENSDVDLFIELKNLEKKKLVEKTVKEVLYQFETVAEQTWALRKINLPIKPICGSLLEPKWKELSNEINGTGIVLYGSYSVVPEGLHQNCLVNYSLSSLSQKRKMNLLRALYGYSSTKAGKKYNKQGIVSSITATKMGANQVLVRIGDINKITGLLKKFNVPFKIREIWSRNE